MISFDFIFTFTFTSCLRLSGGVTNESLSFVSKIASETSPQSLQTAAPPPNQTNLQPINSSRSRLPMHARDDGYVFLGSSSWNTLDVYLAAPNRRLTGIGRPAYSFALTIASCYIARVE